MKKNINEIKGKVLSNKQMKEQTGGFTHNFKKICYWMGGTYTSGCTSYANCTAWYGPGSCGACLYC